MAKDKQPLAELFLESLPSLLLFGLPCLLVLAYVVAAFIDGIYGTNILQHLNQR
jgi:hypothetical protein